MVARRVAASFRPGAASGQSVRDDFDVVFEPADDDPPDDDAPPDDAPPEDFDDESDDEPEEEEEEESDEDADEDESDDFLSDDDPEPESFEPFEDSDEDFSFELLDESPDDDFVPLRLSVLKKPDPLKVTPTGWKTFFTAIFLPVSGWGYLVRVSSVKACWTSMVSPVATNL